MATRNIYLKIERLLGYDPVAPQYESHPARIPARGV